MRGELRLFGGETYSRVGRPPGGGVSGGKRRS